MWDTLNQLFSQVHLVIQLSFMFERDVDLTRSTFNNQYAFQVLVRSKEAGFYFPQGDPFVIGRLVELELRDVLAKKVMERAVFNDCWLFQC